MRNRNTLKNLYSKLPSRSLEEHGFEYTACHYCDGVAETLDYSPARSIVRNVLRDKSSFCDEFILQVVDACKACKKYLRKYALATPEDKRGLVRWMLYDGWIYDKFTPTKEVHLVSSDVNESLNLRSHVENYMHDRLLKVRADQAADTYSLECVAYAHMHRNDDELTRSGFKYRVDAFEENYKMKRRNPERLKQLEEELPAKLAFIDAIVSGEKRFEYLQLSQLQEYTDEEIAICKERKRESENAPHYKFKDETYEEEKKRALQKIINKKEEKFVKSKLYPLAKYLKNRDNGVSRYEATGELRELHDLQYKLR